MSAFCRHDQSVPAAAPAIAARQTMPSESGELVECAAAFDPCPHLDREAHFKHANRPFRNMKEMDDALYRNWTETVGADERLIVVGDIAMSWSVSLSTWERIEALPGRPKHLIFGNHDLDYHGNRKVGASTTRTPWATRRATRR